MILPLTCFWLINLPGTGYSAAIIVKQEINLLGNIMKVDSYNSADPTKSTNGIYISAKAGDFGDVICYGSNHCTRNS